MIIDNKQDRDPNDGINTTTVWDYMKYYTDPEKDREGVLDIVTGFFSVTGLELLGKNFSPNNEYRMVLAQMVADDQFQDHILDLLNDDCGIENALHLSEAAKNALEFLRRDKVHIKAIINAFCHAKLYLFKDNHDPAHNYYVQGSSNLTYAGLGYTPSSNVELNLADTGNSDTYRSLRSWFEEQWKSVAKDKMPEDREKPKGVQIDVKQYFIQEIEKIFRKYTPEEIYYKILFELFNSDLDLDGGIEHRQDMQLLQTSVLFNYQQKGVISLIKMLRKYNGAILADAVGLGKTFSALAVIKYFQTQNYLTVLLCPKKLEQNWDQYLRRRNSRFEKDEFDYIVIDEAHRTGSQGYQSIMSHFTPRFYLGMTATPNRTDGYDVFALFNHVIAFQITLQDALAEEMLAPFHYFGIHDLEIDDETVEDTALFGRLTSDERVRHITEKIEEYSVTKSNRRGLIFCNRNAEAKELSRKFNALGYRTTAISGQDSDEVRDVAISRLEAGELEYIFSVDIMNEGVDIPSLNQIIMLRRTDSAIIFIQQLGRGLRLDSGKEYALVLDFIGNYQSNFLVPIALSGDKTYNKDRLRRLVQEGDSVIPGCSTVSFDRISEARIYKAIDGGNFTSARFLKNEYLDLRQKLGKIPSLLEFDRNGSIDPLLIFKSSKSYHDFLSKYEPDYTVQFSSDQIKILRFISQKLAAGKRFEDLYLLQTLVEAGHEGYRHMREAALRNYRAQLKDSAVRSAIAVLKGDFATPKDFVSLLIDDECGPRLTEAFATALRNAEFKRQILEVLDFGIARNRLDYAETYENTNFVLNAKYTYEEVCRLMNWEKNINGQNLGGYFYDEKTNTFPVFINYDKAPDISESIQYEDRFVSPSKLVAISKNNRTLNSPEIQRLKTWPENGLKTYLFMRKNKDDKGGKEFYFLGEMHPTGEFEAIKTKSGDNAVEIEYELNAPVRQDIYEFMLSDLSEAE